MNSPALIAQTLGHSWAPTFGGKFLDLTKAHRFLRNYSASVKWAWDTILIPTISSFASFLSRTKPSAPGPDGTPYQVWSAAGDIGLSILDEVMYNSIDNKPRIDNLNDGLWFFTVKKSTAI